ncbi:MAG: hypothetical protein KDA89_02350 [Planctomycetaceae bacterium]|nr:hypothetical protein [Planctomycetaceae bacterium]
MTVFLRKRPANCLAGFGLWLFDRNFDGVADEQIRLGQADDVPVTGDWNGDGICDIGVCRTDGNLRTWELRLRGVRHDGEAWNTFQSEDANSEPVTADINGDGIANIGDVVRLKEGRLFRWMFQTASDVPTVRHTPGLSGTPIVGDWNGDQRDDRGIVLSGTPENQQQLRWKLYVDAEPQPDEAFADFRFGVTTDVPIVGDWNADGKCDPAVFRTINGNPAEWLFDTDGRGGIPERECRFGKRGDIPVILSIGG